MLSGQGIRADRPRGPLPLPLGRPPLADPLADLLGIEAHQLHEGFITEQQARQGMHALDPKQGLHPIEQDILTKGTISRWMRRPGPPPAVAITPMACRK